MEVSFVFRSQANPSDKPYFPLVLIDVEGKYWFSIIVV